MGRCATAPLRVAPHVAPHVTSGTAAPRRRTVGVKMLDLRVSLVSYRHSPTFTDIHRLSHDSLNSLTQNPGVVSPVQSLCCIVL